MAALLCAVAAPAAAQDGQEVFAARCASCHSAVAGARPGAGPNLAGVLGRRVGGDPAYDYSPVLRAARQEGRVWDAASLDRFLVDPDEMFPGLWMNAAPLRTAGERAAVVRFLGAAR